jgi:ribosomal protein S18 acetylase RimI-like enzyme
VQDVPQIVGIHERAFPGFFLTELGPGFLRALYAGMIGSNDGVVIVAEDKGLVGFVAGSPNQARLYRELRNRHLVTFGFSAATAAIRYPCWAFRLLRAIGRPREAGAMSSKACLMSIAVDPLRQASGTGSEMVRQFEAKLIELGCQDYCLTTDTEHNAPVREFYERLGLSVSREKTTREGRRMLEYYKRIMEK